MAQSLVVKLPDFTMQTDSQDETFRPRKGKWALVLLGSGAFVAGSLLIVSHPESPDERFWGYAGIVFFGLCGVVSFMQLLPGSSYLRLNRDGITICTMWRITFYRWSDIERFGVAEFTTLHGGIPQKHRMVGMDFSASFPHRERARAVKSMNRTLTGFEGALPDNYGWDYTELAEHLTQLKEQYEQRTTPK